MLKEGEKMHEAIKEKKKGVAVPVIPKVEVKEEPKKDFKKKK